MPKKARPQRPQSQGYVVPPVNRDKAYLDSVKNVISARNKFKAKITGQTHPFNQNYNPKAYLNQQKDQFYQRGEVKSSPKSGGAGRLLRAAPWQPNKRKKPTLI